MGMSEAVMLDMMGHMVVLGKKGKVFPYSLPSVGPVGPGADPGVQAVSPLVT